MLVGSYECRRARVPNAKLEVTVGLHGRDVERISEGFFVVRQVAQSLAGFFEQPLEAFLEEILEELETLISMGVSAYVQGFGFGGRQQRNAPLLLRRSRFTKPSYLA